MSMNYSGDYISDSDGGKLRPSSAVMRNRIINGAMVIDQRNAGAATTNAVNGYTLDRWYVTQSTSGKIIVQQNAGSVTPPVGFKNYLGVTSQSSYSLGADDYYMLAQFIEGYNVADLGWGTANAKTITLSFQVYSSLTGTFGGSLSNGVSNRSYPFTYTVSTANTWTTASVTIAGDTSGTWATDNTAGLKVWFGLGVGTTYSGTAGSWSGNFYLSATGATSVVGTSGATFYITGVQLEVGSNATGFEYRQYGIELALCQRYYEKFGNGWWTSGETTNYNVVYAGSYKVDKRATPTCSLLYTDLVIYQFGVANRNGSGCSIVSQGEMFSWGGAIKVAGWSTITTGQLYGGGGSVSAGSGVQPMAASAEL